MKNLVIALFVSLLLCGCGSPDLDDPKTLDDIIAEAVDWDKLQKRGKKGKELYFSPNAQTPYSGWAKGMYENGQVVFLGYLKDGKGNGLSTEWYENGQKRFESNRKDGKLVTTTRWKPNGEKCSITNVVDGNGVVVVYNDDGTEDIRYTYKNGESFID